jgi:hypothetical protein
VRVPNWHRVTIPEFRGAAGRARVSFRHATFRLDPASGRKRYPAEGDFGPALIAAIYSRHAFFVRRRGWLWRAWACRRCGGAVGAEAPRPHCFEVPVGEPFPPFTLELEVPAVQCGACGTWSAVPARELVDDINEAMIAAFAAEGIAP